MIRRVLVALALATTSLVMFGSAPAFACSCALATPAEYADRADAVFAGTITATDGGDRNDPGGTVTYTVDVTDVYEGEVAPEVHVLTSASSTACGAIGLPEGEPLMFFAAAPDDALTITSCGGTGPATQVMVDDVVGVNGPGTAPVVQESRSEEPIDEPESSAGPWLVGGALGGMAGAVLLGVLLRRRRGSAS